MTIDFIKLRAGQAPPGAKIDGVPITQLPPATVVWKVVIEQSQRRPKEKYFLSAIAADDFIKKQLMPPRGRNYNDHAK